MKEKTTLDTKMNQLVQGNELIESAYRVSLDEMRIICLALTKIDSRDSKPYETYRISVQEFVETFGIEPKRAYDLLRDAAIRLSENPVRLQRTDKKGRLKWVRYPWFSKLEYFVDEGSYIELEFSPYVEPYLYDVRSDFTEIDLQNLALMETPFATRLYSWLIRYRHMNNTKRNTGNEVTLTVEWMKERALLQGNYPNVKDFRKWVIEPAIQQINAHTDISVTYEPVREGRRINAFKFFYITEQSSQLIGSIKVPLRPRLPRRPHVLKGSHEEGVWARKGINLLLTYKEQLKEAGKKLTLADMRRLKEYYGILGDTFAVNDVQQAIMTRQNKQKEKAA